MKETILIIVLGCLIIACTATDCNDTKVLPYKERRARNYQADGELGSDPLIDDEYTGPDWFNVEDYRMPDSRTKPTFKWCGTRHPIYIEGTHPDVDELNDMPVTVCVCEVNPIDDYSNNWNIEVRKCGDDIHYYLPRTRQQSAYCLDPPDIHNVTDFDSAPVVHINTLRVAPTLALYTVNGFEIPYLRFDCIESPAVDRSSLDILYATYWFVDSTLTKPPERINQFVSINETELTDKGYKLGFLIRCGIRVSTSITGIQTDMVSSSDFFAGVTVEPSVLSVSASESAQITLQSTVPFGCYYELNKTPPSTSYCKHKITMQIQADAKDQCVISVIDIGSLLLSQTLDIQAKCGAEIKGFYPNDIRNADSLVMPPAYMNITLPFISYSTTTTEYRLSLTTPDSGIHDLWRNALMPEVQVNIIANDTNKYKMKTCYAGTDPHIIHTADGRYYNHNSFGGDFIMYQHARYTSIQVQMRTILCKGNRSYCPCAVAVRAGGDVFLINLCNGSKFKRMTSCVDGGALVVRRISENKYEVRTYIGTLITLTIRSGRNLIYIYIQMAPKDYTSTRGLCGTFDGNRSNDYHDRNGSTVNNETTFIRQWELTKDDINLLEPTCELPVSAWNANEYGQYCTCNCSTEGSCKTLETTAVCSPSQYLNCVITPFVTSDMCKLHADRCSVTKKRSSFYIDPEVEMKRKAALAHKPHSNIVKREATGTEHITEDEARTHCTNTIETKILIENEHLLGNFNVSQIIEDCTFDVFQGQDPGWAIIHKESADTVIQVAYKLDSNYTSLHEDDFKAFKTQACPYNCSGTGVCTEQGICDCFDGYSGPDCVNSKSEGQVIEDVEGGGLCDQRYGSECRCFTIQANFLDELFMCRRERKRVLINGEIEDIDKHTVNGSYENIYNGECCFDEGRRKRSIDSSTDVQHYQYYVSVSNDGLNFGPQTILYIYDSICLNVTTDNVGYVTFELQTNTCLIDGDCYYETETDFTDACNTCIPETNLFKWTYGCSDSSTEESPEDSPVEYPEDGQIHGIIIAVCATTGLLLVVLLSIAVVVCIMKGNKNNREISSSQGFTNGLNLTTSREPSQQVFDVRKLTN